MNSIQTIPRIYLKNLIQNGDTVFLQEEALSATKALLTEHKPIQRATHFFAFSKKDFSIFQGRYIYQGDLSPYWIIVPKNREDIV